MAKKKTSKPAVVNTPQDSLGHDTIALGIGGEGKKETKVIDAGDKMKGAN